MVELATVMDVYHSISSLFSFCRNQKTKVLKGLVFCEENREGIVFLGNVFERCVEYIRHYVADLSQKQNSYNLSNELVSNALRCLQVLVVIPEL